jgi:hypothetical protein
MESLILFTDEIIAKKYFSTVDNDPVIAFFLRLHNQKTKLPHLRSLTRDHVWYRSQKGKIEVVALDDGFDTLQVSIANLGQKILANEAIAEEFEQLYRSRGMGGDGYLASKQKITTITEQIYELKKSCGRPLAFSSDVKDGVGAVLTASAVQQRENTRKEASETIAVLQSELKQINDFFAAAATILSKETSRGGVIMTKKRLDSNDIIETFSHPSQAGKNPLGVHVLQGEGCSKCPSALLFVCEAGVEPIKRTISDTLENIRCGELVAADFGPRKLNLAQLIPTVYSLSYYNIKDDVEELGFAILVPGGYKIDIPKDKMVGIFSRIFQALCYSTGGRC